MVVGCGCDFVLLAVSWECSSTVLLWGLFNLCFDLQCLYSTCCEIGNFGWWKILAGGYKVNWWGSYDSRCFITWKGAWSSHFLDCVGGRCRVAAENMWDFSREFDVPAYRKDLDVHQFCTLFSPSHQQGPQYLRPPTAIATFQDYCGKIHSKWTRIYSNGWMCPLHSWAHSICWSHCSIRIWTFQNERIM